MYAYLSTFFQVPPSLLEMLSSFRRSLEPSDWCLSKFQSEDTISVEDENRISIPSYGRSGSELRHCYILRSVENSSSLSTPQWSIRQMVVYHSFDVETGRSFWMTAKGNDLIRIRVEESFAKNPIFQAPNLQNTEGSLSASLSLHLLIFGLCEENWQRYINQIEQGVRKIIDKAKTAKIDTRPYFATIPEDIKQRALRSSTGFSKLGSRKTTLVQSDYTGLQKLSKAEIANPDDVESSRCCAFLRPILKIFKRHQETPGTEENSNDAIDKFENLVLLDMFSFEEVQELQRLSEKIQEALLVLRLNLSVIHEVGEYYRSLECLDCVPDTIKVSCRGKLAQFFRAVRSIETKLQIKIHQWEALDALVKDGKILVCIYDDP